MTKTQVETLATIAAAGGSVTSFKFKWNLKVNGNVINSLCRAGLLVKTMPADYTNVYTITDAGRAALGR